LFALLCSSQAFGQAYKATIGYDKLQAEVGAGLANGAGVVVALAEANVGGIGTNTYFLLTWNAQYKDSLGNFTSSLSLADMDLRLFQSSNGVLGSEISASLSTIDNVEHIYLKNLSAGGYTIQVSSDLDTRFGLAWNITAVPEPSSIACLFVVGLAASIRTFQYKRRRSKCN